MVTDEILSKTFSKVSERHNMLQKLAEKDFLSEYTFIEVHYIAHIGKSDDPNVTKMAKSFHVTRGAMSKIIKKLIEKGAVDGYQKAENKKEIYYKLTEIGKRVFLEHDAMHHSRLERDKVLFSKLSEDEKMIFANILNKVYEQLAMELRNAGMEEYI